MDPRSLAKYPFLPEARTYIQEKDVALEEIITVSPSDNYAVQDAWNRIFGALVGKIAFVPRARDPLWMLVEKAYKGEDVKASEIKDASSLSEREYSSSTDIEIPSSESAVLSRMLSYPIARIMVSCTGDRRFIRRYALKEAELFRSYIEAEYRESGDLGFLQELGREMGLNIEFHDNWAAMDVVSYVKNTAQMKDRRKSLLFQDVSGGMVRFHSDISSRGKKDLEHLSVIFRSFQQALYNRLEHELPLNIPPEMCGELFIPLEILGFVIREKYEHYNIGDLGPVDAEKFPPCMKHLLGMAKEGVNLPHSGRFALTAFLHMVGMSVDDIVAVFSASPDFNESMTRYQVRHITGEISGTEYTPQKCSVMISEGLCHNPDELCKKEWMNHPLTYYRASMRSKNRSRSKKKGSRHS